MRLTLMQTRNAAGSSHIPRGQLSISRPASRDDPKDGTYLLGIAGSFANRERRPKSRVARSESPCRIREGDHVYAADRLGFRELEEHFGEGASRVNRNIDLVYAWLSGPSPKVF